MDRVAGNGSAECSRLTEDLANALQVALLIATGFERALVDTRWARDAVAMRREVDRAARAAHRLCEWLRQSNGTP